MQKKAKVVPTAIEGCAREEAMTREDYLVFRMDMKDRIKKVLKRRELYVIENAGYNRGDFDTYKTIGDPAYYTLIESIMKAIFDDYASHFVLCKNCKKLIPRSDTYCHKCGLKREE